MSNTELESLVRSHHDRYLRVMWLMTGDRELAAKAVSTGLKSLPNRVPPNDAAARQAIALNALRMLRKDASAQKDSRDQVLGMGSLGLITLVAIDWAGLSPARTARSVRLRKSDLVRLHRSAVSQVTTEATEGQLGAVLTFIETSAGRLPGDSLARRSKLLDELRTSAATTGRSKRLPIIASGMTLSGVAVAILWLSVANDHTDPSDSTKSGNAEAPTSLRSMDELSDWAKSSCRQPGGDFDELSEASLMGKLVGEARLGVTGPLLTFNGREVSILLLSPTRHLARFCYAATEGSNPDRVDWYITEFKPSEVLQTVAVRPRGTGYFAVFGGEDTAPVTKADSKITCPDGQAVAQTVTTVAAMGTGVWQVTCAVLPSPDSGVLEITSRSTGNTLTTLQMDDFTEVPITQTLLVHPVV